MEQPLEIRFSEPVSVDGDRLVELCVRVGEARAEELISTAIDNLWCGLEALRDAYRGQRLADVAEQSRDLSQIGDELGLHMFARVARDVEACAARVEGPALGACLCRLHRVADSSINSVWEMCDVSV